MEVTAKESTAQDSMIHVTDSIVARLDKHELVPSHLSNGCNRKMPQTPATAKHRIFSRNRCIGPLRFAKGQLSCQSIALQEWRTGRVHSESLESTKYIWRVQHATTFAVSFRSAARPVLGRRAGQHKPSDRFHE